MSVKNFSLRNETKISETWRKIHRLHQISYSRFNGIYKTIFCLIFLLFWECIKWWGKPKCYSYINFDFKDDFCKYVYSLFFFVEHFFSSLSNATWCICICNVGKTSKPPLVYIMATTQRYRLTPDVVGTFDLSGTLLCGVGTERWRLPPPPSLPCTFRASST